MGDPVSFYDPFGLSGCRRWVPAWLCKATTRDRYDNARSALGEPRMSRADIAYASRHPYAASRINVIGSVIEQRVAQMAITGEIPGGLEGIEDGPGDAIRHAAFMCAVTRLVGAEEAMPGEPWIRPTMPSGDNWGRIPKPTVWRPQPARSINFRQSSHDSPQTPRCRFRYPAGRNAFLR